MTTTMARHVGGWLFEELAEEALTARKDSLTIGIVQESTTEARD